VGVAAMMTIGAGIVSAQDPQAPVTARPGAVRMSPIPLEVQVVIAKYLGEKRIGSLPYILAVNAATTGNWNNAERAQMTIGSDVPVPTTIQQPEVDGKPMPTALRSFSYKNVGTTILAQALAAPGPDDGVFELDLSIDESSVGNSTGAQGPAVGEMPVFKSFKTRNRLVLRNAQTRTFTVATDRVSGETIRIDVTLTVVK
jgi:hypothetical protein